MNKIIMLMIALLFVGCAERIEPHYEIREVRIVGVTEYHVVWVTKNWTATRDESKFKTLEEATFKYEELVNPNKYNKTLRGNETK